LGNYKIAETETFEKKIKSPKYNHLYKRIFEYVYPLLRENPFYGSNIKKLRGEYKEVYRYRIGNYRLFYKVVEDAVMIFIIDMSPLKKGQKSYKQKFQVYVGK
jgi:mRNA interferase RelE/StbE